MSIYDTGGIDGIFGAKTEAALRDFQRSVGLNITGAADPPTVALLLQTENAAAQVAATEAPAERGEAETKPETAPEYEVTWSSILIPPS